MKYISFFVFQWGRIGSVTEVPKPQIANYCDWQFCLLGTRHGDDCRKYINNNRAECGAYVSSA